VKWKKLRGELPGKLWKYCDRPFLNYLEMKRGHSRLGLLIKQQCWVLFKQHWVTLKIRSQTLFGLKSSYCLNEYWGLYIIYDNIREACDVLSWKKNTFNWYLSFHYISFYLILLLIWQWRSDCCICESIRIEPHRAFTKKGY
jgi:hypothetical protein